MGRQGWQHVDVPSTWIQVIHGPRPNSVVWPKARLEGVRMEPRSAQSQQYAQKTKVGGIPAVQNERFQTPSEQRRQRESAGCRRPSTVWETETQKPKRCWSRLLPKHRTRRRSHTRQIEEFREFISSSQGPGREFSTRTRRSVW